MNTLCWPAVKLSYMNAPGADRLGRVVADGDDRVEVLAEVVQEARVGELQRDVHLVLAGLLDVGDVDVADRGRADLGVLLVEDPLQREDDVLGRDRLAVVELDPGTDLDHPGVGLALLGLDRLGDHHLQRAEARRAHGERLIQVPAAHDVRVGGGQVGVDRVLGAAAGGARRGGCRRPSATRCWPGSTWRSRWRSIAAAAAARGQQTARAEHPGAGDGPMQDLAPRQSAVALRLEVSFSHPLLPSWLTMSSWLSGVSGLGRQVRGAGHPAGVALGLLQDQVDGQHQVRAHDLGGVGVAASPARRAPAGARRRSPRPGRPDAS